MLDVFQHPTHATWYSPPQLEVSYVAFGETNSPPYHHALLCLSFLHLFVFISFHLDKRAKNILISASNKGISNIYQINKYMELKTSNKQGHGVTLKTSYWYPSSYRSSTLLISSSTPGLSKSSTLAVGLSLHISSSLLISAALICLTLLVST
jgi:hypothetical protein